MTELFLEYENEYGNSERARVAGDRCVVGRHSASDICIPDDRLSRSHLNIERVEDVYLASDAGSSNGTTLNGRALREPTVLRDGDVLELGGLRASVILSSREEKAEPVFEAAPEPAAETDRPNMDEAAPPAPSPSAAASGSSASMLLWIMIPVFGLVFIVFAAGIVYLIVSQPTAAVAKKQNTDFPEDEFDPDNDNKKPANKSESGNSGSGNSSGPSGSNTSTGGGNSSGSNTAPTANLSATAKIEQNGGTFLRRIAQNDPRAFLTTEQAGKLSSKVKQFSSSSAVADNLNSARKSSSQIKALAESRNLKPEFLAIAAIAKLGSSRGDVLQTAQGMTDTLDKLTTQLGNELADDSLLVIAAYSQGAAGDTMKMRNMLQDLANKSPDSSRAIRTIWFLQKNGKITQAEYENALNFLAIGTISQNPKDFGVSAEALTF